MTRRRPRSAQTGRLLLAVMLGSAACATQRHAAPPSDALAARFALQDAQRARELAPDLYARSERARKDAALASDPSARKDHELRAQLLLEAAIAEADRVTARRAALAADARAEQWQQQRAELERRRLALEAGAARENAARSARAQAVEVLQTDANAPVRDAAARERAAAFVCDRATLLLAAAIGLGLDEGRADALERSIERVRGGTAGAARVTAAKRVLLEVQRALDEARAARAAH